MIDQRENDAPWLGSEPEEKYCDVNFDKKNIFRKVKVFRKHRKSEFVSQSPQSAYYHSLQNRRQIGDRSDPIHSPL